MNISDEAVEAAARKLAVVGGQPHNWANYKTPARLALEAAAPHLLASALALADQWQEDFPYKANQLREAIGDAK